MSRRRPDGSIASGTIIDRYLVDVLLGAGGMGEVYAARDQQLGRTVALKILAPDRAADPSRVQRFLREAQLASSLSHPAIVTVYDSGSKTLEDGRVLYFLAMELVDGETLSVWARSARDPQKIVDLLAIVADGLARAHASGIVHRDLKPQNIMVARGGHPKILDFGVAKLIEPQPGVADTSETAPSQAVGTGAYMAPEQVEGVAVDHRADIFAFGAVMYEALTGSAPFGRRNIVESMHAVLHDQPATPDVAPELARIVRKCLVKDREQRYQSIRDVAIDLREAVAVPSVGTSRAATRVHTSIAFGVAIVVATLIALAFGRDHRNGPSALAAPSPVPPLMMRRVTNSGNISAGAVSPDGNYIVHSTVDGEKQTVWVRQVATGTNVRIIPPEPVYYFDFQVSSDGNYVFYTVATRAEPNVTDLRRIPLLGGESRLVAKDMEGLFTVSPDAQRVAIMRFNAFERLYRLILCDVETGAETLLIARPYPGMFGPMAWAPDGKSITFIGAVTEKSKPMKPGLFSVDLATRRISTIPTPDWRGLGGLVWLPDGSGLLLTVSDPQQPRQIWFLPRGSTAARKITSDISMYNSISVTADSRSIVAQRADVTANLFVIDAQQPAKPRALTTGLWNCFGTGGVRWVPGGKILYTVCGATTSLNLIDPVTADSREIQHGFGAWHPSVSPDGQHIAFVSDRAGPEEIWISDIDGNEARQLTHQGPLRFPTWSPDGKTIYCNSQGNTQTVWRVSLDGRMEQVVTYPTNSPDLSPDGKLLLCRVRSSDPKTQLWRTAIVPLAATDKPRFLPIPRNGGPPRAQWIGATSFAYLDYIGGVANLWFEDMNGGATRQITRFDSGDIISFDVSRDGRYIAMSRGEHVNDIVLIRNFR